MIRPIQSRNNPQFKAVRSLNPGFGSDKILVEGPKLVREALAAGLAPESFWTDSEHSVASGATVFQVPTDLYRNLSPTRSGNPPLAVFPAPTLEMARPERLAKGRWLLLDQVQDPGNAGALARAAAAFGFDGVLWRKPCVYPYHHACIRAAAGNVFHLPQLLVDETSFDEGVNVISAGADGTSELASFCWPDNLILAMGNEGHGHSALVERHSKYKVRIDIHADVESLNVAGAAHILMYFLRRIP